MALESEVLFAGSMEMHTRVELDSTSPEVIVKDPFVTDPDPRCLQD